MPKSKHIQHPKWLSQMSARLTPILNKGIMSPLLKEAVLRDHQGAPSQRL